MTEPTERKWIPLSVIDSHISKLQEKYNRPKDNWQFPTSSVIEILEEIKKEAIPGQEQGQPLEPLSCPFCPDFMAVNDNDGILLLCQHIADRNKDRINLEIAHNTYAIIKRLVETIANQRTKPLEQRVKDRIKELEPMLNHDNWCGLTATRIDELRKLLS